MEKFKINTHFEPKGDQPGAILKLADGLGKFPMQTLLGITGSGKTFTIANVINKIDKPTLIVVHNKTLAFQLYSELKELFPNNRIEYFISYFDYYQPESYLPQSDTYIEKDSKVNKQIELLRLKTMSSLLSRRDVIVVSSISCIYGAGNPQDWNALSFKIEVGQEIKRTDLFNNLVNIQYERNDLALEPGRYRVRGSTIDLIPGYEKEIIRINFLGDEIKKIQRLDAVSGNKIEDLKSFLVFPASHFVVPEDRVDDAIKSIKKELEQQAPKLPELERQRLTQRTNYDIEMIQELGYCNGIENYSAHFDGRIKLSVGDEITLPPYTLIDYFPKDFLLVIDESHQTIPQAHGMYHGDKSRKKNLIDHGFRLPSAYGNRPLKFEEFEKHFNHVIFVSATPGDYELVKSGQIVEQIVRPTGLLDPEVVIKPTENQVDSLIANAKEAINKGHRVLVTTLTKRMAEDLTEYLSKAGIKVRYLHSEIDSLQRTEIIRQLRLGEFDLLVGINLLREGLDIPEVALVCVLDADKEGFLRDERSLIQTIGRAARNVHGKVILYADKITRSIKKATEITANRRKKQIAHNKEHGITPQTVIKKIAESQTNIKTTKHMAKGDIPKLMAKLEAEMRRAAEELNFEKAIELREQIKRLEQEHG